MSEKTSIFQKPWLLVLLIALPLFSLVGLSLLNGRAVEDLEKTNDKVTRVHALQQLSAELLRELVDNETGQRGYILAQDPAFLAPYEFSLKELPRLSRTFSGLASGAREQALFEEVKQAVAARMEFAAHTVAMQAAGDHAGSVALIKSGEGKKLMDRARAKFQQLDGQLVQLIQEAQSHYAESLLLNQKVGWAMVAVQSLFLVALVLLLLRLRRTEHFVHMCAWSRTIEYEGEWLSFEEYLSRKFHYSISHGISPEEAKKLRSFSAPTVE